MANKELRGEVERAVIEAVTRLGPSGFSPDDVVRQFIDRPGASRSSLFRWIAATLKSGKPGQAAARKVKAAAARRAKRTEDPAADAAAEVASKLPGRVTVADVTPVPPLRVVDELREAMADVKRVREYAKTPEGGVRNAKLILQSCEVLRRCLETAMRLVEGMHSIDKVEHFHSLIIDEIAKLAPETAEALVIRLGQLSTEWGG